MSTGRLLAIAMIFGAVSIGWMVLGGSMMARTERLDNSLSTEMQSLWGPKVLVQPAPYWAPRRGQTRDQAGSVAPSASTITADIRHDHRYKGLLWYSTFTVDFQAEYAVPAMAGAGGPSEGFFVFALPDGVANYDELSASVGGKPVAIEHSDIAAGRIELPVGAAVEQRITIRYTTGGQEVWLYTPGQSPGTDLREGERVVSAAGPLCELKDFSMTVKTNFADIDYPKGARSPTRPAEPAGGGTVARWEYPGALTNQPMGIVMPKRTNAGPIAARMSFFAPVSLLFFFTVLFTIVVLKRISLHPMHYLFISAAFFAFHILMAYLVDILNIHAAFWICAAVSVFLVASYMRLVAGVKFGVVFVGLAQLVFLVGFSYAFFWVGRTGLTVTIAAIATLFVLMQATGKVDWNEALRRRNGWEAVAPPAPPAPSAGDPG